MTILVVSRALLPVGKDFVGFLDFLEVFFRLGIVRIAVRMVFHGQLAVGLFDLVIGSVTVDAKDVVKVAFAHGEKGEGGRGKGYSLRRIDALSPMTRPETSSTAFLKFSLSLV